MKTRFKNLFLPCALVFNLGLMLAPSARSQFLWSQRVASNTSLPTGGGPMVGLTLDGQTNCYLTGCFDGTNNFGGLTLTNQSIGGSDIFVAKYNVTRSEERRVG